MTVQHTGLERAEAADHSLLIAEAAAVLPALAMACTPQERAEDFADLSAIHAEGAEFPTHSALDASLGHLLDGILTKGHAMAVAPYVSATALSLVRAIHQLAQDIALVLNEPEEHEPALRRINQQLLALDPSAGCAHDLQSAVAATAAITHRNH